MNYTQEMIDYDKEVEAKKKLNPKLITIKNIKSMLTFIILLPLRFTSGIY